MAPKLPAKTSNKNYAWIPDKSPIPGELLAYAKMPAALLLDHRLDGSHIKVFMALSLHAMAGRCAPSQSRIAEILGWYVKGEPARLRVNAALHGTHVKGTRPRKTDKLLTEAETKPNGLIAWGWVKVQQGGFDTANTYELCVPELENVPPLKSRIIDRQAHDFKKFKSINSTDQGLFYIAEDGELISEKDVLEDNMFFHEKGVARLFPEAAYKKFGVEYLLVRSPL